MNSATDARDRAEFSPTWHSSRPPPAPRTIGLMGWGRVVLRGSAAVLGLAIGLAVLLSLRLARQIVTPGRHPAGRRVTQITCRWVLFCLGLPLTVRGRPHRGPAVIVANHLSWLDILVLNAVERVTFVAKAEVAGWPGIGGLARATGTVFIHRRRRDAGSQAHRLADRIGRGDRLALFPEGTSTDGAQVLPFRPSLFAALLPPYSFEDLLVQPVCLEYVAPPGADPRFYAWWGSMALGPHLLQVLAAGRQGQAIVTFSKPLRCMDYPDRKSLAAAAQAQVARSLSAA